MRAAATGDDATGDADHVGERSSPALGISSRWKCFCPHGSIFGVWQDVFSGGCKREYLPHITNIYTTFYLIAGKRNKELI